MVKILSDVRWKQRFQNYEKAFRLLSKLVALKKPTEGERMGIIQAFEMSFELAWKMMGDYLKEKGYTEKSPKDILKQAFHDGILQDGHVWIEALEHRNETVHVYDKKKAKEIEKKIKKTYTPALKDLYEYFKRESKKK